MRLSFLLPSIILAVQAAAYLQPRSYDFYSSPDSVAHIRRSTYGREIDYTKHAYYPAFDRQWVYRRSGASGESLEEQTEKLIQENKRRILLKFSNREDQDTPSASRNPPRPPPPAPVEPRIRPPQPPNPFAPPRRSQTLQPGQQGQSGLRRAQTMPNAPSPPRAPRRQ